MTEKIVLKVEYFSTHVGLEKNKVKAEEEKISAEDSKIEVWVVPTNEELMIIKDTYAIVNK